MKQKKSQHLKYLEYQSYRRAELLRFIKNYSFSNEPNFKTKKSISCIATTINKDAQQISESVIPLLHKSTSIDDTIDTSYDSLNHKYHKYNQTPWIDIDTEPEAIQNESLDERFLESKSNTPSSPNIKHKVQDRKQKLSPSNDVTSNASKESSKLSIGRSLDGSSCLHLKKTPQLVFKHSIDSAINLSTNSSFGDFDSTSLRSESITTVSDNLISLESANNDQISGNVASGSGHDLSLNLSDSSKVKDLSAIQDDLPDTVVEEVELPAIDTASQLDINTSRSRYRTTGSVFVQEADSLNKIIPDLSMNIAPTVKSKYTAGIAVEKVAKLRNKKKDCQTTQKMALSSSSAAPGSKAAEASTKELNCTEPADVIDTDFKLNLTDGSEDHSGNMYLENSMALDDQTGYGGMQDAFLIEATTDEKIEVANKDAINDHSDQKMLISKGKLIKPDPEETVDTDSVSRLDEGNAGVRSLNNISNVDTAEAVSVNKNLISPIEGRPYNKKNETRIVENFEQFKEQLAKPEAGRNAEELDKRTASGTLEARHEEAASIGKDAQEPEEQQVDAADKEFSETGDEEAGRNAEELDKRTASGTLEARHEEAASIDKDAQEPGEQQVSTDLETLESTFSSTALPIDHKTTDNLLSRKVIPDKNAGTIGAKTQDCVISGNTFSDNDFGSLIADSRLQKNLVATVPLSSDDNSVSRTSANDSTLTHLDSVDEHVLNQIVNKSLDAVVEGSQISNSTVDSGYKSLACKNSNQSSFSELQQDSAFLDSGQVSENEDLKSNSFSTGINATKSVSNASTMAEDNNKNQKLITSIIENVLKMEQYEDVMLKNYMEIKIKISEMSDRLNKLEDSELSDLLSHIISEIGIFKSNISGNSKDVDFFSLISKEEVKLKKTVKFRMPNLKDTDSVSSATSIKTAPNHKSYQVSINSEAANTTDGTFKSPFLNKFKKPVLGRSERIQDRTFNITYFIYRPNSDDPLDVRFAKSVNSMLLTFPITFLARGKYRFDASDTKVLNLKLRGPDIMVRVGGGYVTLQEFFDKKYFKNMIQRHKLIQNFDF
eukprot:NODE_4_length_55019_cov_0.425091.p2 type:complete len:1059 gc:universal NODE_4_length_55019_cov_0.425091:24111-20935(-)